MSILVAIDPGVNGAIALDCYGKVAVCDMPTVRKKNGKREIDIQQLLWILPYSGRAIIEDVHSMGKRDGSVGSFTFGRAKGIVEGICWTRQLELTYVSPQKWKSALGLTNKGQKLSKSELKELSRLDAITLFPTLKDELKRKKDHNRAEALLLLHYIRSNCN